MPTREQKYLARLYGIVSSYHDVWGTSHSLTEESLLQALGGLGIAATSATEVSESIRQRKIFLLKQVLEPVRVLSATDRPIALFINLPESEIKETFSWSFTLEDGEEASGQFQPSKLSAVAVRSQQQQKFYRYRVGLGAGLPLGYHRFTLIRPDKTICAEQLVIVVPRKAFTAANETEREWGITCQLYALRSKQSWGIGDFGALRELVQMAAAGGAAFVGLNPLHALCLSRPHERSPYSPSSRTLLNPLYIALESCEDFKALPPLAREFVRELGDHALLIEESERVDYGRARDLKLAALVVIFEEFSRAVQVDSDRLVSWQSFRQAHHSELELLREKDSLPLEIERGLRERGLRSDDFLAFLQWEAHRQLSALQAEALTLGMRYGLYLDLALGVVAHGVDAQLNRELLARGLNMGCPPDDFNLRGQNWGLSPFLPWKLRETGYQPFIAALRGTMRYAGLVRIDHVMSLFRLYCIPQGLEGSQGFYLRYRVRELMGIVALESVRHRCVVVGEDLGTVPAIVQSEMAERGILSYRVFWFMTDGEGRYTSPEVYPRSALVTLSTHDLPALRGFWRGRDLGIKQALQLFPSTELLQTYAARRELERSQLRQIVSDSLNSAWGDPTPEDFETALFVALERFLAHTPSALVAVQLEDCAAQIDQPNLPGTVDEHCNWAQRLPFSLRQIEESENWRAVCAIMRETRRA